MSKAKSEAEIIIAAEAGGSRAQGRRCGAQGRRRNRKMYGGETTDIKIPQSAGDVKRLLAETMAGVAAGRIDPKVGSTVGHLTAAYLRADEADPPPPAERPSIYRALGKDQNGVTPPTEIYDYQTGKPCGLRGPNGEVLALPSPTADAEVDGKGR